MDPETQKNFYIVIDKDGEPVTERGYFIPKHKIVTGYDELTEEK